MLEGQGKVQAGQRWSPEGETEAPTWMFCGVTAHSWGILWHPKESGEEKRVTATTQPIASTGVLLEPGVMVLLEHPTPATLCCALQHPQNITVSKSHPEHPGGTKHPQRHRHPTTTTTSKTHLPQPQHGWDQPPRALQGRCLGTGSQRTSEEGAVGGGTASGMSHQSPSGLSRAVGTHLAGQSGFGPARGRGSFAARAAARSQPGTTVCFGPGSAEPNAGRKCLSSRSRKLLFMHVLRPQEFHLQPVCSVTS